VVQPLVVRPSGTGYQLITGERRWRAAQRAGLPTVPCLVRDTSDSEALQIALVENLQREDLNAMDAARGYHQLVTEFGISQEQVASVVGKSRSAIANTLRLLELPQSVQAMVEMKMITEGHARALLPLLSDEPEVLAEAAEYVAGSGMTVRETEEYVRSRTQENVRPTVPAERRPRAESKTDDPNVLEIEERLQRALGTKVRLRVRRRGGTISISYHNSEELDRLLTTLDPPASRFGEFD
jgi:ParB family chromosome partitioning protein